MLETKLNQWFHGGDDRYKTFLGEDADEGLDGLFKKIYDETKGFKEYESGKFKKAKSLGFFDKKEIGKNIETTNFDSDGIPLKTVIKKLSEYVEIILTENFKEYYEKYLSGKEEGVLKIFSKNFRITINENVGKLLNEIKDKKP